MNFSLNIISGKNYILVKVSGILNHQESFEMLRQAIELARKENIVKILFDGKECIGKLSIPQRIDIAQFVVKLLFEPTYIPIHFAIYGAEPLINKDNFNETVAINRGIHLFLTTKKDKACEYLDIESPDSLS